MEIFRLAIYPDITVLRDDVMITDIINDKIDDIDNLTEYEVNTIVESVREYEQRYGIGCPQAVMACQRLLEKRRDEFQRDKFGI